MTTDKTILLPVLKEFVDLTIRTNVTAIVRVQKTVDETETVIEQDLVSDIISIEHIPLNTYIEQPATMRQEGNITVIPVMEEIVVTRKQLVLKEEIRITRQVSHALYRESVPLRSEQVQVERLPVTSSPTGDIAR